MHVALHGGHHHLAGGGAKIDTGGFLLSFEIGLQVGHGLLHDTRRLHHLRQEHLARAEQIADHVHAGHQRAFDDVQRLFRLLACLFRIGLDELGDAVHQRVRQPFLHRRIAPGVVLHDLLAAVPLEARGGLQQAIGGIGAAIENHILAQLAQFRRDIVIDGELTGVNDAHVHAGLNGVVQEHRVHRLAHRLVAAEGERQVRHAT